MNRVSAVYSALLLEHTEVTRENGGTNECSRPPMKLGIRILQTVDMVPQQFFLDWAIMCTTLMCSMSSGIPGLDPDMSPDIAKCSLEHKVIPVEITAIKLYIQKQAAHWIWPMGYSWLNLLGGGHTSGIWKFPD